SMAQWKCARRRASSLHSGWRIGFRRRRDRLAPLRSLTANKARSLRDTLERLHTGGDGEKESRGQSKTRKETGEGYGGVGGVEGCVGRGGGVHSGWPAGASGEGQHN